MSVHPVRGFRCAVLGTLLTTATAYAVSLQQTLDESWTLTVEGQSVQAAPDGSFRVSGVLGVDVFDEFGQSTTGDGFGDDFVRVIGTRDGPAGTEYALSTPFRVELGETIVLSPGLLTFTDTPPPLPVSIELGLDTTVLTQLGATAQANVLATLPDGSLADVTASTEWTTYTTSNASIATVDPDGRIAAASNGFALITARNEATVAVATVQVALGEPQTTLVGFVLESDGTPVADATVDVLGQTVSGATAGDGSFVIDDVISSTGALTIQVTGDVGGSSATQQVPGIVPIPGEFTDAGIVQLEPGTQRRFLYAETNPNPSPSGNRLVSGFEIMGDGNLIPVPNSPAFGGPKKFSEVSRLVPTLGASHDGRFLFSAGNTSGTIITYEVGDDGQLSQAPLSPLQPPGSERYLAPIVATSNNLLIARYRGAQNGIRTLQINADGSLTDTGTFVATGGWPTQMTCNEAGDRLFVMYEQLGGMFFGVESYAVLPDGQLQFTDSDSPASGIWSMALSPTETELFITATFSGVTSVRGYEVQQDGSLGGPPTTLSLATPQSGFNFGGESIVASPLGEFLYAPQLGTCTPLPFPGELAFLSYDDMANVAADPNLFTTERSVPVRTAMTSDGAWLYIADEGDGCDDQPFIERYSIGPDGLPALLPASAPLPTPSQFSDVSALVIVD